MNIELKDISVLLYNILRLKLKLFIVTLSASTKMDHHKETKDYR